MSESNEAFQASVLSISSQIKQHLHALINALAQSQVDAYRQSSESIVGLIDSLYMILLESDRPKWLAAIRHSLLEHKGQRMSESQILDLLHRKKSSIDQFKWFFENDDYECFDFDKMFERYRDEGKLPELFDEIIDILTQILHSGDVESSFVIDALKKVIGTLKQSKSGSLFSMNAAWQFFCDFAQNYLWGQISSVTGLEALTQTLRDTIEKTNAEVAALTQLTYQNVRQEVADDLNVYSKKNKMPSIKMYSDDGKLILEGESKSLSVEA